MTLLVDHTRLRAAEDLITHWRDMAEKYTVMGDDALRCNHSASGWYHGKSQQLRACAYSLGKVLGQGLQ